MQGKNSIVSAVSLGFTVHEMICEKASVLVQGHAGYNLLDETAVRYGHSFTMLAFGVGGGR